MKLLIVIDSLGAGGAERSTAVLADHLHEHNIIFQILCLDEKEIGVQQEMQEKGYSIGFLEQGNFFSQSRQIARIIKKGRFDLVHSILFRSNLRTRFAKFQIDFCHMESLVNTTYSKERFSDKKINPYTLKFYKYLDRITAQKGVDHFHSITNTVKDHYVKEIALDPEKITVIPRGRKRLLADYEERPERTSARIQLINVGRHEFQKGQIFLLQAAKVLKEKGYDFHLKIFGRNGNVTNDLNEYIVAHHLQEYVSLEGFSNKVPESLLKADIFVFPSLYEGLGGALIEAQAAGLPIACNDIPVLHEVVKKDINAKFFNSHDPDTMAEAIRFFMDHRESLKTYGRKSLENFEDKFLESTNNEKLINLYQGGC